MRIIVTISLILGIFARVGYTADRDEVYKKFGPKLIEAVVETMRDEINDIRVELSIPIKSSTTFVNEIDTKLDGLSSYSWMGIADERLNIDKEATKAKAVTIEIGNKKPRKEKGNKKPIDYKFIAVILLTVAVIYKQFRK